MLFSFGFQARAVTITTVNLVNALCIQKESWVGVVIHFSEIIKLQFGNKTPYIATYFTGFFFFLNNRYLIISKKCVVTHNLLVGFQ